MKHPGIYNRGILYNYYGIPKPRKMTAMKSVVFAQQFDDGKPIVLGSAYEKPFEEMPKRFDHAKEMSGRDVFSDELGNDYFVESFEEERPVKTFVPEKNTSQKSLSNEELLADIQSIQSGRKQYDNQQKKVINTNPTYPERPAAQEGLQPLENNSKHRVFEQMAQSMRYANAYDLGSISMQNRFDDFDRKADKTVQKENVYDVQYYEPEPLKQKAQSLTIPAYEKASTADFVEDLDFMTRQATTTIDWCQLKHNIVRMAEESSGDVWGGFENGVYKKKKESDPAMLPVLEEYWKAVPGVNAKAMAKSSATGKSAWSAAFISYVMKEAGVKKEHGFIPSQRHITYMVEALRNREAGDETKAFWLHDVSEIPTVQPTVGDLLCQWRDNAFSYSSLKKEYNGNTKSPAGSSHCDIIISITDRNGKQVIETIGGNVGADVCGAGEGCTAGSKYFVLNAFNQFEVVDVDGNNTKDDKNQNKIETRMVGILKIRECPEFPSN